MRHSISLIALVLLLAVGVANAQNAPQPRSPFALRVVGPKVLLVDESSWLEIEVENVSDKPTKFVPPLDGSWARARYPRITVAVTDATGHPVVEKCKPRCGVMNPLRTTDIETLAPGEKRKFGVAWPALEKAGTYSVKLTYDLTAPDLKSWLGSMTVQDAPAELPGLLKQVPHVILQSAPFRVQVRDIDTQGIAQALVTELVERIVSPANVSWRDYWSRKWQVTDVRRANGYFSCLVEFAQGYSPVGLNGFDGFAEGRYLFRLLDDWRWHEEKAAAAERDFIWSRYEIFWPGDGRYGAMSQARSMGDKKTAKELVPGCYDPTPQMKHQKESIERHPLYRALTFNRLAERMKPARFPDYWISGRGIGEPGVEVSFEPLVNDEGYIWPAAGIHFAFEADAIKVISIAGELRYLLLSGDELSAPLRGLVAQVGLSGTEIKGARVLTEIQPDGRMTLWLEVRQRARGAFSGELGNNKATPLPAPPPQKGHRF